MKKLISFCIQVTFLFSMAIFADEIVTRSDGSKVLLKDDHTWIYLEEQAHQDSVPIARQIKYADDAVEVWDKSLSLTEVNYSNSVALYLHYLNHTDKKVVGVTVFVSITNPFGKILLQKTFDDEIVIQPKERLRNSTYWHFDDNPFISGEAYDLMWQAAQNGTAKITSSVRKVIFEDGTVLTSRPKKK